MTNYTQTVFELDRPGDNAPHVSEDHKLVAYRWEVSNPKALVVIAHGMGEHARRYPPALTGLFDAGFSIYGIDHRGHGQTMTTNCSAPGDFGSGGFAAVIDDLCALVNVARREHPTLPLYLLGHSMGSFIAQAFLQDYSEKLDGIILVGTAAVELIAASVAAADDVMKELNKNFEPGRTPHDWLSSDPVEVDKYIQDPLCGFALTPDSMGSMLAYADRLADIALLKKIKKGLPMYVLVGGKDPLVSGFGRVEPLLERYREAGLNPEYVCYPEGRHEILNEVNRDQVVSHLLSWLESQIEQGGICHINKKGSCNAPSC